jgi:hypothetical protein
MLPFKATTLRLQPESSAVRREMRLAHSEASASEAGGVGQAQNKSKPRRGGTIPNEIGASAFKIPPAWWDNDCNVEKFRQCILRHAGQGVLPKPPPSRHAIPSRALPAACIVHNPWDVQARELLRCANGNTIPLIEKNVRLGTSD